MTDRQRSLRLRSGFAITCAGVAALSGVTSCVSDDSAAPAPAVDASIADGAAGDAHVAVDSSISDAGVDTAVQEASSPDAQDSGPPPCGPTASLTGFTPRAYVPAAPYTSAVCDAISVDSLYADCFGDASTYASCASYPKTGGDDGGAIQTPCLACELTPEDALAYGAVVEGVVPVLNVAGCIERQDQTDAGLSCATALQTAWQCTEFACKSTCPVSDQASRQAYATCAQAAATGVCSSYTQPAAACLAAYQDAGTAQECFFDTSATGFDVVDFFCGT